MEHTHDGHRLRLRQKYLKGGASVLEEHELLELLLFYAIPRKNTNDIAHALLKQFGSIKQILNAGKDALLSVPGIGENAAIFFDLITDFSRIYFLSNEKRPRFATFGESADYISKLLFGKKEEHFYLFSLDVKLRLIGESLIMAGSIDSIPINMRDVISAALNYPSKYIVLAHNHPTGDCNPTLKDIQTTKEIVHALSPIGVSVVDHIIVSDYHCYSFSKQQAIDLLKAEHTPTLFAAQYASVDFSSPE